MRDEPNVVLKRRTVRSSDPTKGVGSYRQQAGGHGSRNPLRSVYQRRVHGGGSSKYSNENFEGRSGERFGRNSS
eukprot:NODE_155_length_1349_cov_283.625385_g123_i0.p3 GENE.NODE_155_length_1349_cov_283.625385_g123_i0~~NODE_155_length_1349_cov_283.625385_g123_i0.p3  ORF type:complete len:74 (-),score=17.50 NODE_155_length_1349_cov_283.625385_g123_i0:693-914(-)